MVNGGEFVGGALLGSVLGPFADIGRETIEKCLDFKSCVTNLEYTQKSLQPSVDKIEAHNIALGYPDEIKDLKATMDQGAALHDKLKDASVWSLATPFLTDDLVELEESRHKQVEILGVQGIRDVKENLVLARDHSSKLDDCKTDVKENLVLARDHRSKLDDCKTGVDQISAWTDKFTLQIDGVASEGKEAVSLGRDSNKKITDLATSIENQFELSRTVNSVPALAAVVEQCALGKSVEMLHDAVHQASLKSSPVSSPLERIRAYIRKLLAPWCKTDLESAAGWGIPPLELKAFRVEIDKGVELARKCSQVTEWTTAKTEKYANKILGLEKTLQALAARLGLVTRFGSKDGLKSTQSNYTTTNVGPAAPETLIA